MVSELLLTMWDEAMNKLRLLIPLVVAGSAIVAWTQEKKAESSEPPEERMRSETPMSGRELFEVYCAACHGREGRGDGPAAGAMKAAMPDLTRLRKSSGGEFPIIKVERAIDGDEILISHGTRDMPIYGDLFRDVRRDEAFVKQRVALITGYIESIQDK